MMGMDRWQEKTSLVLAFEQRLEENAGGVLDVEGREFTAVGSTKGRNLKGGESLSRTFYLKLFLAAAIAAGAERASPTVSVLVWRGSVVHWLDHGYSIGRPVTGSSRAQRFALGHSISLSLGLLTHETGHDVSPYPPQHVW